jgi:hypothetical protein
VRRFLRATRSRALAALEELATPAPVQDQREPAPPA